MDFIHWKRPSLRLVSHACNQKPALESSTERAVVTNSYRRVVESLPLEEYQGYYVEVPLRGKRSCLGYLTHYENINMNCDKTYSLSALSALKAILDPGTFARDFRSKQETGSLDDMQVQTLGFLAVPFCLGLHLECVIMLTLITVDHSAMLFGQHRSFQIFSNQGFEASHKEQRRFCCQATNHDSSPDGQSSE
ncbi:PREDICTED: uncharacterized protein LOC107328226 isoform X2 [Acropora digitifera]|uniref:uncharacterized protein LOC107328226 isoform X2 n=1 Tax=Acropora digitifera TaxID=70779 RepID=UPI00077AC135|nr:PREDICTED: uncharacterized protein LOC107328226 isoform X2 [Acropora digitifera]